MKKIILIGAAAALLLGTAMTGMAVETGKAFLWDGTHWGQVTLEAKAGYIFGIGNLADFEMAAQGSRKSPCISQAFTHELKKRTVMQVVEEVDKYYQENPGKLNTPVIEVVLRRCTSFCPPEPKSGTQKK